MTYANVSPKSTNCLKLPFGYEFVVYKGIKFITVNENKALAVKHIYELMAQGNYHLVELSSILKKKYKFNISDQRVKDILTERFYTGYIGSYKHIYLSPIPMNLFDKVQDIIANHKKRGRIAKKSVYKYKYAGVFTCGMCGCKITSETQKGHIYYACNRSKNFYDGHKVSYYNEKYIDEQISAVLDKYNIHISLYEIRHINQALRYLTTEAFLDANDSILLRMRDNIDASLVEKLLNGEDIDIYDAVVSNAVEQERSELEMFCTTARSIEEIASHFRKDIIHIQSELLDLELNDKIQEDEIGRWKTI